MKTAYILTNIGTPKAPTAEAVKPYLTEFLTDPDVIPLPWLLRQVLVRGLIVPRRSQASAEKYALIWTDHGSPLMVNSEALRQGLEDRLNAPVFLGMQYGEPSMRSAFEKAMIVGAERIVQVPLYPQYAEATTGAARKKASATAKAAGFRGKLDFFPPFPLADFFIGPLADAIRPRRVQGEYVLFTFHGLPESQVKQGAAGCLVAGNCCDRPLSELPHCYRAQSFATARSIAARLGLKPTEWSVSFQSRLGRAKWIGPYTEDVLKDLPARGVKNVLVVSPSFVSDCLETLEELGHQGKATFHAAGGEAYTLVPCPNGSHEFSAGLARSLTAMT